MFTGIISDLGQVLCVDKNQEMTLLIKTAYDLNHVKIGASIACNGVCLTVTSLNQESFSVQVSLETCRVTTLGSLKKGDLINLEKAVEMGQHLDGHLVAGHVDGITCLLDEKFEKESWVMFFKMPKKFEKFIVSKGSITLNGVSLTVNEVNKDYFSVNIIPHTQKITSFHKISVGDFVNFEVDLIARYLEKLIIKRDIE